MSHVTVLQKNTYWLSAYLLDASAVIIPDLLDTITGADCGLVFRVPKYIKPRGIGDNGEYKVLPLVIEAK